MRTRRQLLQLAMGALGAGASGSAARSASAAQSSKRPPNIVLMMADDLGYECLACNGAAEYRTPNLDRLAAQGLRFTNAHSTPLCTPSRVQLMTGKYGFRNYTEFGSLPQGQGTFAHHLHNAGYRTGVMGKWQLAGAIEGTQYKGKGTLPEDAGFDEHCLWQVTARGSRYWDPTVQTNGVVQPARKGEFGSDIFADFGTAFIERHRERPFLLYYPMNLTHDPFVPTPHSKGGTPADKRRSDPVWYGDMVAYMDYLAGRIIDMVNRSGIAENTVILFTGDNGTHPSVTTKTRTGDYRGGKGGTTASGTHVPFIARWQGRSPKGVVCEDLVDFTDFFPTLSDAAGTPMPDGHPRDGSSFLPQLWGEKGTPREQIYCHYNPRWGRFTTAQWVMDHRWKLYGDGRFFDLRADPLETKAPIDIPGEARATADRFRSVLSKMRA